MSDGIVEVIVGRQRRRRWTVEEKLRIVAETDEPGARIGDVAARHDVYPGLLFTWRRQVREGVLRERHAPLFLPVEMASALNLPRPSEQIEPSTPRRIEIELSDGCRIKIDEGVGLASLRRVLAALRG
ncbi:MAG: transposase [Rhodospirillales bacterium]|nr:transposase [Rhodospirillales bacterium]